MKIAGFFDGTGAGYGLVDTSSNTPASPAFRKRYPTLRPVLVDGALPALRAGTDEGGKRLALDAVRFLPPVPDAGKVICVDLPPPKWPIGYHRLAIEAEAGDGQETAFGRADHRQAA